MSFYIYISFPFMILNRMEMTAISNKIWIIDPMLKTKNPKTQSITNTTAIV